VSSRTGNAFRGFVRDRAQDAREVADASEAGRTPAENERKVFSGRERFSEQKNKLKNPLPASWTRVFQQEL